MQEDQVERLGPFACEFFAVNHSIPDAMAVAIRSGAGTVLHTGDFKMDQLPLDGRTTDLPVTGKVMGGPTVSGKGFSEDPAVLEGVVPLITEALDRAARDDVADPHQLQQVVRRTVGRWVNDTYRRRPMIVPTVVEV